MMQLGFYHPERGYWQTKSEPPQHILDAYPEGTIEVPLKPGANYEWQDGEWVYASPDEATLRASWRETASLTRAQFCVAVKRAGLLPEAEAIDAAKGNWPQTFSDALSGLPVDETEAQIVWASVTEIPRNDTVLEALRVYAGMTDEQIDEMFGWEASE